MEEIIVTYNDLSEKKKADIYEKISKVVKKELMGTKTRSEWINMTFGEFDKLVEEKIKECKFKFVM